MTVQSKKNVYKNLRIAHNTKPKNCTKSLFCQFFGSNLNNFDLESVGKSESRKPTILLIYRKKYKKISINGK